MLDSELKLGLIGLCIRDKDGSDSGDAYIVGSVVYGVGLAAIQLAVSFVFEGKLQSNGFISL
jgi:hypothetical protein